MHIQTTKRLIALKFEGIHVTNLEEYGTHSSGITYVCKETGRLFHFVGAKEITEITASNQVEPRKIRKVAA